MPSKFNPLAVHLRTWQEAIDDILQDEDHDARLTPGQIHGVVNTIYGEPAFKLAALLALNDNPKSKVKLSAELYVATNRVLHQMMYAPLQPKDAKRKAIEEFQMEFAWMTPEDEKEAAE